VIHFKWLHNQNNRYWSTENPHPVHEVGDSCAVSVWKIIGPMDISQKNKFQTRLINLILIMSPFFNQLTDEEKFHRHFMQHIAMAGML
jgi:hypothetical protein